MIDVVIASPSLLGAVSEDSVLGGAGNATPSSVRSSDQLQYSLDCPDGL